tara:strand:+ start:1223 stop:1816 length:594 start_codon:yes stop_codon:yes gene_type:complete
MLSAEKIEKNYKLFVTLCNKLGDRSEPINKMIEHLDERLAFSPASSRLAFHAAYPGGFIEHSLNVLRNARKLNDIYEFNIPLDSLIVASLFHDLGKVGDLNEPLYLDQDSDWHREKLGQMYKINENIQKMPNAERGLWLLQHFGVKLTLDEWIAIRTNDGPIAEENRVYAMCEPKLAIIVHQADRMACEQEKDIAKS